MSARLPRVLNAQLGEERRLHPTAMSLTLTSPGVSQAEITLAPSEAPPTMHQWLELYSPRGSVGYFRVINTVRTYTGETQVSLRQGIDTLADSVLQRQEDFSGTVRELLQLILGAQTARVRGVAPWQLGAVADTTTLKRSLSYDKLSDLLSGIEEEKYQYAFTYDFSTWPWTLNFTQKPQEVASEFRLSRNIDSLQVTFNDADLCTQLLLSVNVTTTETPPPDPDNVWPSVTTTDSVVRTYNNTQAQAVWGIVQKTASIDTDDDIAGQGFPSADAWAARYMADHAEPTLQIQIDGADLYEYTFDPYDEASLGRLCRVSLPDYSAFFSERVVSIQYPDLYGAPDHITVSLANRLPRVTSAIAAMKNATASAGETAAKALRASGGVGGGGAAKELESWAMIVKKVKESEDATGITEMYESGILLDAEKGIKLYSLGQGFVSQYAELNVQKGEISTLVRKTGINELGEAETMYSRITQTADAITAEVTRATTAEGQMSTRITQTADAITAEVTRATTAEGQMNTRITQTANAIALKANQTALDATNSRVASAEATLTVQAGQISSKVSETDFNGNTIASKINQTATTVQIEAQKIELSGYVTASQLNSALSTGVTAVFGYLTARDGLFVGNGGASVQATWQTTNVITSLSVSTQTNMRLPVMNTSGEIVGTTVMNVVKSVGYSEKTIYYLGQYTSDE